jgi:hypothetical protein
MFKTINDVPAAISEFYVERIESEQVFDESGEPVLAEETYTYMDEEGVEQTGTKQVPTYEDVAYVDLVQRGQSVSWDKVDSIIAKHQGKKPTVVDKFISLAQSTDKWSFHDSYLEWMEACAEIELYNATEQLDEEGNPITFEPRELPSEPVFIAHDVKPLQVADAKIVRDSGRYAPIEVEGMSFDVDEKAYENIKGAITSWDILVQDLTLTDIGLVDGSQMLWTLSDNTTAWVTKELLETVVGAVSVRAGLLQAQYMEVKA